MKKILIGILILSFIGVVVYSNSRKSSGQLQVNLNGIWENVCCVNGFVQISKECEWTLDRRILFQDSEMIWAEEMKPSDVICGKKFNRLHGITTNVGTSVLKAEGGPIFPDNAHKTCFVVRDEIVYSVWTKGNNCDYFRLF